MATTLTNSVRSDVAEMSVRIRTEIQACRDRLRQMNADRSGDVRDRDLIRDKLNQLATLDRLASRLIY